MYHSLEKEKSSCKLLFPGELKKFWCRKLRSILGSSKWPNEAVSPASDNNWPVPPVGIRHIDPMQNKTERNFLKEPMLNPLLIKEGDMWKSAYVIRLPLTMTTTTGQCLHRSLLHKMASISRKMDYSWRARVVIMYWGESQDWRLLSWNCTCALVYCLFIRQGS